MINKNKLELAKALCSAVEMVLPLARCLRTEYPEEGLFCDFETEKPLDRALFDAIGEQLAKLPIDTPYLLDRFSGVYEDDDASKPMLQRVHLCAFDTSEELSEYMRRAEEAALRDHKALGAQMKLFSSGEDIGQGLTVWHPKGAMLRYCLEQFGQAAHLLNGYQWVYSPHIGRAALWQTSGHLDFYKDSMYSPISIDGEEYYLKPMNCPFHIHIYNSELRSYRELPFRMAEYGTVYRYELSGTLSGLTRVRGFTQDDAHILCTEGQIASEVENALKFSLYILRSFGFTDFEAYVSTKPEKKSIGTNEKWEMATEVLKAAVSKAGLSYRIDEGGGAFYGPKIDLKLRDALGREWQCSTIQFDFNLPERFSLGYIGKDGQKHTPLMVHRALFGSLERFTALLIEHYKGDFPLWFAPVQIGIVPIRPAHNQYCQKLAKKLKRLGLRVEANLQDENMRAKIKAFQLEKIPYLLVAGDREMENSAFSVRSRKNGDLGSFSIDSFLAYLRPELDKGVPKDIFDEEDQ